MNVVARWPGSSHDATVFNNSVLKSKFIFNYLIYNMEYSFIIDSLFAVQCEEGLFGNRWLIGDSAYPCTSYLLTPLLNPTSPPEHRYNEAHIKTRNTIER